MGLAGRPGFLVGCNIQPFVGFLPFAPATEVFYNMTHAVYQVKGTGHR